MSLQRRRLVLGACGWFVGAGTIAFGSPGLASERRVQVRAVKFSFSVSEISARKGETLVVALSAADFVHGFAVPELKARIDVPPGKEVELRLNALPAGRFVFLCDNFCGEEHDRMTGRLTVS